MKLKVWLIFIIWNFFIFIDYNLQRNNDILKTNAKIIKRKFSHTTYYAKVLQMVLAIMYWTSTWMQHLKHLLNIEFVNQLKRTRVTNFLIKRLAI